MSPLGALEARGGNLVAVEAAPEHSVRLLTAVARAWEVMKAEAAREGVGLVAVSGFRDLERQRAIWNRKFAAALEDGLDEAAALARVLEYSAPPGWSRHHWGTDLDLVGEALAAEPRLEEADWDDGGPCAEAGRWLARRAADFGFVRPYDRDRGGFRPEPWHWSFGPIARPALATALGFEWTEWLRAEPFAGSALLLRDLARERDRFLLGIDPRLIPDQ
ncbi:MAG: M15 family metallopeptidase [Planctomycetota bacterium]